MDRLMSAFTLATCFMVQTQFFLNISLKNITFDPHVPHSLCSPGLTSSEQQARTQSRSEWTTRASMAVVGLFSDSLTSTMALWCCLEKHVSGSSADTGSDIITMNVKAA